LMIGAEFVKERKTKKQFGDGVNFGLRIGRKALRKGLILRFDPHWIAFAPPLVINKGEVDKMMDIFSESLRETIKEVAA